MFEHLDVFVDGMEEGVGSAEVICELFSQNDELIERLDRDFISRVASALTKSRRDPSLLRILEVISTVSELALIAFLLSWLLLSYLPFCPSSWCSSWVRFHRYF